LYASGGKATNVAYLAAKLGLPAVLVGRVGADSFADTALQPLEKLGVDVTHVRRMPGTATGVSMIVVRDDGDKTIVLAPNANMSWEDDAERAVRACIERVAAGSIVCVDLEIPPPIALAALRAARARDLCTVLDPSPGDRARDELFAHSQYVAPNPREAERITGVAVRSSDDAQRAGRQLLERGARYACMKMPDGGAVLVSERGVEAVSAPKVEVVDKTGAGDGFAAGLCAGLCQGLSALDAVRQAVAAASCAVTRYGSQAAYPTRAELDRMLAEVPA
jgi:ribokinase